MENNRLIEDISVLTQIPVYILEKISDVAIKNICHQVYTEHIISEKNIINVDLEIGILSLEVNTLDGTIEYTFIPSKQLEKDLIETMREKKSVLTEAISSNLNKKVLNLYRELL